MLKVLFKDLVFEAFKDSDSYERIAYQINKAREIMCKMHKSFGRMPVEQQFNYCMTIASIASNTASYNLNKFKTFTKKKPDSDYPYALEAGFKETESIPIGRKRLTDKV